MMNLRADTRFSATPVPSGQALTEAIGFAGLVSPQSAWDLFSRGEAALLDVRTIEERAYVGRIEGSLHVAWATGTAMNRNPHFIRQVAQQLPDKAARILLLCRSGKRSAAAAEALTKAGYTAVYSVDQGFEGNLDAHGHRGGLDGWRFHGLPWLQD
ncbi:rhodanese-like domain-containing protein [Xinfangfangia sp. D13-10-4-6]|uniref:rhodanese-like domain-containing protein n=1 Tax=Pseudogemmobacter hezensis TaxID=2737662 RepID=UPI001555B7B2|nr:rhodanese-like domain-containing protein [Pseudogemmobacter hezensis]NPD16037.1 rhodanese-like domain-containing protein [Pseudogemmobacter hezensis]